MLGYKSELELGFSRRGLVRVMFDLPGDNFSFYEKILKRVTAMYGLPIRENFRELEINSYTGSRKYGSTGYFIRGSLRVTLDYYATCGSSNGFNLGSYSASITIEAKSESLPPPDFRYMQTKQASCSKK